MEEYTKGPLTQINPNVFYNESKGAYIKWMRKPYRYDIQSDHVAKVLATGYFRYRHAVVVQDAGVVQGDLREMNALDFLVMCSDLFAGLNAIHAKGVGHGNVHFDHIGRNPETGRWALFNLDYVFSEPRDAFYREHLKFEHLPPLQLFNDLGGNKDMIATSVIELSLEVISISYRLLDYYQLAKAIAYQLTGDDPSENYAPDVGKYRFPYEARTKYFEKYAHGITSAIDNFIGAMEKTCRFNDTHSRDILGDKYNHLIESVKDGRQALSEIDYTEDFWQHTLKKTTGH